ncbi:hypothetical protein ACHQM5_025821 [Ranunculus cassubicifolius]
MASPSEEDGRPQPIAIGVPNPYEYKMREFMDNCAVRSLMSGVAGGGMGVLMGFLLGALDSPLHQDTMTTRQQIVHQIKSMGSRSYSSAKTFALLGFVFAGSECVVEKARAKHDIVNQAVAGCVTGAVLSGRGGPKAACLGCAGFSAFSVAIEKFLDRHT